MPRKTILHIIEWSIALAALAYLVWRLATYDDYAALGACLRSMGWPQYTALAVCVMLMPVNMLLEAWRWRTLMNAGVSGSEAMSWHEAHRQVYYSKLAGLVTPWRLGEYPARGVLMNERVNELRNERIKELRNERIKELRDERIKELRNERIWSRVLSMGAVGSATMTAVIVASGAIAMMMYDFKFMISNFGFVYFIGLVVIAAALGVGLYFAPRMLKRYAEVSHNLVMISLAQSFVRLTCWCIQLALVLYALGAITPSLLHSFILSLFIYYLFVTITPNVPVAEAGVRGAWAILVFGTMNAALAGVLLWAINTLLPCLVWPFLRKNTK